MQAEISCHRVRKVFGKGLTAFEAVTAATLSVAKVEFVCLLGPSGCGKSTLLMMIAGLEAVHRGNDSRQRHAHERAARGNRYRIPGSDLAALEDGSSKCTFSDRDDGPESLGLSRSCDGAFAAGAPRRCNPQAPSGAFRRDAAAGIALPRPHFRSKRFADGRAVHPTPCPNAGRPENRAS